ncbi:MAG: tetratricopeptide repeat protein [Bacteroidota bacterium]|nr:tetratricopeptide repeat protein [Bacteroidota bacterium]
MYNRIKNINTGIAARHVFSILLFVFFCTTTLSQNSVSLYKRYLDEKNPKKKVIALVEYSNELHQSNVDSAVKCNELALKMARQLKDEILIADVYMQFAFCEEYKTNYIASLNHLFTAADLYSRNKYNPGLSKSYTGMGIVYWYQGLHDKAIEYFNKNIAISFLLKDKNGIASSYGNLAIIFDEKGELDSSLVYYQKAMKIFEEEKNIRQIASCLDNMSVIYAQKKDFINAIKCNDQGFQIRKSSADTMGMMASMENLGLIYIKQKNPARAIEISNQVIELAIKNRAREDLKYAYINLKDAYELKGDYKAAFKIQTKLMFLKDSLRNEDNISKLAELEAKYNNKEKEKELIEMKLVQKLRESENESAHKKKNLYIWILIISGVSFLFISFLLFKRFKEKNKIAKELEFKNEAIEAQKRIIDKAYNELTEINKDITDSIKYAKRIQKAIFPHSEFFKKLLPDSFVLLKPKDIVSGDFYWLAEDSNSLEQEGLIYLAVCDSTGHGVPGSFMSLLNIGFLSEAIKEKNISEPNKVFEYVRERLISTISKENQKDGFDGILLCINKATKEIKYVAANNSPVLISNGSIVELSGDRMPVGQGERKEDFKLHTLQCKEGDVLYLYTDGYADQFGGPKGKKFKYKPLNELLLSVSLKPLNEQSEILLNTFNQWKGPLEQVDDMLVIGLKV